MTAYEVRISDWSSDVCSSVLHIFQFIQAAHWLAMIGHGDAPDFAKVRWIDDSQLRRAVAHDDVPAVLRHAPAFALVAKAAREREIIPTPAKAHAVLPCKTENFVLPRHDSLDRKSVV